jgi:hypothetical protein
MQIREMIKLLLLSVTAVATCIVAYATYETFVQQRDQAEQPVLALEAYKIAGTEEVRVDDTANLPLKKVHSEKGLDDYELPLQVANNSNKDVDDVRLHIDVEMGELVIPTNGWETGSYADHPRYFARVGHLLPHTRFRLSDLKIRIKNTTHEVKLNWSILGKGIVPPNNVMIFRF